MTLSPAAQVQVVDPTSSLLTQAAQVTDWPCREITAGHIASDHGHPVPLLTADTRDQLRDAAEQADHLAKALDDAHQLTSTLHATQAEDSR